jgi:hypothetical protein
LGGCGAGEEGGEQEGGESGTGRHVMFGFRKVHRRQATAEMGGGAKGVGREVVGSFLCR